MSKQKYLVGKGTKLTIGDLSFVPWNSFAQKFFGDKVDLAKYPSVKKWTKELHSRPAVAETLQEWGEKTKKH